MAVDEVYDASFEQSGGPRGIRRFVRTTDNNHSNPVFPNLCRTRVPANPDEVWVADITYIGLASGFAYLAAIIDACSRRIVRYAVSRYIDTRLALAALDAAVENRRPAHPQFQDIGDHASGRQIVEVAFSIC